VPTSQPEANEYAPFYAGYVSRVPAGDIRDVLREQGEQAVALWRSVPPAKEGFRYAPEKWSVREVAGHVIDAERVFACRAMRFGRGDPSPLPGFEENLYVRNSSYDQIPLADLAAEFARLRASTVFLFQHLDAAAWQRRGVASGNEVSVRGLAYILAGHEMHHRRVLVERYLGS
jgi:hypothetical protein